MDKESTIKRVGNAMKIYFEQPLLSSPWLSLSPVFN